MLQERAESSSTRALCKEEPLQTASNFHPTPQLPMDGPSLSSSSLQESQVQDVTHFPGFSPPSPFPAAFRTLFAQQLFQQMALQKVSFIWWLEHLKIKSLLPNDLGNRSQNITFFCATAIPPFLQQKQTLEKPVKKDKI